MSRVSGSHARLGHVVGDSPVEGAQGLPDGQRSRWAVCGQQRAEQPVVHLGVEDREALPVRGEDVGVGVLDLDDEALELEPAKVVAAAALGVGGGVGSEQPGDEWPQGLVGKPADDQTAGGQRAGQGRAMTRGSPNLRAAALRPAARVGRAIRSKAGLARTQP